MHRRKSRGVGRNRAIPVLWRHAGKALFEIDELDHAAQALLLQLTGPGTGLSVHQVVHRLDSRMVIEKAILAGAALPHQNLVFCVRGSGVRQWLARERVGAHDCTDCAASTCRALLPC